MEISKQIGSMKVPNMRDLGGMEGADGKHIKKGLLIRSEQLYSAAAEDVALLESLSLRKVFDFRNTKEAGEKPDPVISGCENMHLPIIDESTLVSWESDKFKDQGSARDDQNNGLSEKPKEDVQAGAEGMCELYRNFVRMPYSRAQYAKFLKEILETEDGAVLWHCTLGKDRCGWGSVLVEAMLGVDFETIKEDYMYTNVCLKEVIAGMMEMLKKLAQNTTLANSGIALVEARAEYVEAGWDEAIKLYGSIDNFLEEGLGIDLETRAKFQAKYLE